MESNRKLLFLLFPFFLLVSCLGPKKLTTEQTYLQLKPVESLPIYDLNSVPVNFEVTIENVADMGSSYKNRAYLYINDYLIVPDEEITNVQDTYHYRLKLRPGVYTVRGEYFALDGFTEKKYEIKPQTKVMVKPETKTKVHYYIEKNWDGTPLQDPMIFDISYQSLPTSRNIYVEPVVEPTQVKEEQQSVPQTYTPEKIEPPTSTPKETYNTNTNDNNLIVLQINTAPSNADVILDDKYIGQSPVRIFIDASSDHIIQLSHEGYNDVIKLLDHNQFGNEKTIHFVQKLNPKN